MTEQEEKTVRAFLSRLSYNINRLRELEDSFAKVGMRDTSNIINEIRGVIQFDCNDLLVKDLKIDKEVS